MSARTLSPHTAQLPELRLKRGEDRRLSAGHLWVFSNEVDTARTPLPGFEPGALCRVLSDRDKFLGYAYVNPHSLICARILGRDPEYPPDKSLIVHRLQVAQSLRRSLYERPFYRLVYGESDALPGLVLDRFGDVVVGQIATAGMEAMRADVEAAVRKAIAPAAMLWKNDAGVRELEGLPSYVETGVRRSARVRRSGRGRRHVPHSARRRAEDRLVLRPGREPAGLAQIRRRRAGARRLQLSRRRGGSARCAPAPPKSLASIRRRRRWKACRQTAAANGLKPRDDPRRCVRRAWSSCTPRSAASTSS